MPMPKSYAASSKLPGGSGAERSYSAKELGIPTRPLFWLGGWAGNLSIQRSNSGTQALGDDLRVMPQCSFGVRVPEVALHILDGGVILHVRG